MVYAQMDALKIGQTLRELRERSKESVAEVAKAIRATDSAVRMYEGGKRIPRDEIKLRIAEHYCIPVESIFFPKE